MSETIELAVSAARQIDGWMSRDHLAWLAESAARHQSIIEVGSWKGRSTKALAMATLGKVYAVDGWIGATRKTRELIAAEGRDNIEAEFRRNLAPEISAGKVVVIPAESADAAFALAHDRVTADMVFIDAAHSYDAVKRDIALWRPFLVPGGLLCGHDYVSSWEGVIAAVDELVPNRRLQGNVSDGAIWWSLV